MAVGDIVTGMSGNNVVLDFQPAAGVEIMISSAMGQWNTTALLRIYNGTNQVAHHGSTSFITKT